MEDRHVTLSEVSPGVFYSAVFDGHGGAKVAEFAQVIHQEPSDERWMTILSCVTSSLSLSGEYASLDLRICFLQEAGLCTGLCRRLHSD